MSGQGADEESSRSSPAGFPSIEGAGDAIGRAIWAGPGPMVIVERRTGHVIAANDAMLDMLGVSSDALIDRQQATLEFWPTREEREQTVGLFRASRLLRDVPVRIRTARGEILDTVVALSSATLNGRDCAIATVTDVTERRHLEVTAARQRDRLASILNALPVGVAVHSGSGEIVEANQAAAEILGLTRDQLFGRTSFDSRWRAVRPDGEPFPGEQHPAMVTLRTGEPQDGVVMGIHRPDGSLAWISISSEMSLNAGKDGDPAVVATFVDITPLEETRLELIAARDDARQADRAKSQFLSIISHELRTPLTAVMGYSQMLLAEAGGPLTDLQREDLVQITRGADRLLALIDDLLDLGRIQNGRMELDLEYLDLGRLLKDLEADLRVMAAARNLSFWMLAEPGLSILGDARRLEQVIINLVSNAVKFTSEGQVRLDATRDGTDAVITVEDTGIGIAPEAQERIWDLFQQGDTTTTRRYGGLGIGLAIARSIVERHGGEIFVESAPDHGARFVIRLPLA